MVVLVVINAIDNVVTFEVNFNEETKITVLIGICEIPKKLPPVILGSCWLKYHTCFLISYTWYLTSGFYYKMLLIRSRAFSVAAFGIVYSPFNIFL